MPMVSHDQKDQVASYFSCLLCQECNGTNDDAIGMMWCWHQRHHLTLAVMTVVSHEQVRLVAPHFNQLDLRDSMVPSTVLLASHEQNKCCTSIWLSWPKEFDDVIDDATGIMWHWYQWHHMNDLRSSLVLFMMPLASHYAYASANGITWPKMSHCTPFWLSWPKEYMHLYRQRFIVQVCWETELIKSIW